MKVRVTTGRLAMWRAPTFGIDGKRIREIVPHLCHFRPGNIEGPLADTLLDVFPSSNNPSLGVNASLNHQYWAADTGPVTRWHRDGVSVTDRISPIQVS